MSKDPAILFYTSDFLTGTQFFTDEQIGQYIKLLCQQHQLGHIPTEHMLNICKTHDSPVWCKFIKDEHGAWFNDRMDIEKEKRINYCASRRSNKMKEYEHKHMFKHMSKHMLQHMDNENENEDINAFKDTKEKFDFDSIWLKYPKRVGKKMALKHFEASVKTKQDLDDMIKALTNYISSKRVAGGFIQNGSTWFNNWRDWIDYKEEVCRKCKDKGFFISTTGYTIQCECKETNKK